MSDDPLGRIIDAALEIVDAEGWNAVSQRRLAAATNYGKSTIEYHWVSRDHFRAELRRVITEEYHYCEAGWIPWDPETWSVVADQVIEYVLGHPNRMLLMTSPSDHESEEEIRRQVNARYTRSEDTAWLMGSYSLSLVRAFVQGCVALPDHESRRRLFVVFKLYHFDVDQLVNPGPRMEWPDSDVVRTVVDHARQRFDVIWEPMNE